jgi:hypothetical protein
MFLRFIPRLLPCHRVLTVLLLAGLCFSACVTQTERVGYYPHTRQEDESVWGEVRREFGWRKTPSRPPSDPFYQRATRGITGTISGWFHKEDSSPTGTQKKIEEAHSQSEDARKLEESRREFEQKRQEALRRLREQQEQQELRTE